MEDQTKLIVCCIMVACFGGMLAGYNIGYVGIYTTFHTISCNCTEYKSPDACSAVKNSDCAWLGLPEAGACIFKDVALCELRNETECNKNEDSCFFDQDSKTCKHNAGWDSTKVGIFAGAMIIGAMAGSFGAGPVLDLIGRKKTLFAIGAVATVAAALVAIGSGINSFALLVIGRIVMGLSVGASFVSGPLYVEETSPEDKRQPMGVAFQIFLTFGIALAAVIGLALNPTDFDKDVHMTMRFQVFNAFTFLFPILLMASALYVPESQKWLSRAEQGKNDEKGEDDGLLNRTSGITYSSMAVPLAIAATLSLSFQFTGINAIMNYAPNITKAAGLKPLLGNFIVMFWNFITTIVSIFAAKKFSRRQMYLVGTLVASLACLLNGISVLPGVISSEDARHALAALGIVIFVAAFEIGMGPPFFGLAMEIFPSAFRNKGASFTNVCQFTLNLVINVCFPIAVVSLSGGKSGNQDKGMSIVFIFFGCTGLASLVVLWRKMFPFSEPVYEAAD